MTFDELLGDYSLEITARDISQIEALSSELRPGMPVSITYLPGDEPETLGEVARRVAAQGITAIPHISARRIRSAEQLDQFLDMLRGGDAARRAFVIAGDRDPPLGPYVDALDILRSGKLAQAGVQQVGIAGYPEGHPQISAALLDHTMREKLAVIRDARQTAEIVTQFTFDAAPVVAWLERLRESGIDAPVRIGLAGPASAKTLLRFAARCGVDASRKVIAKYGLSLTRLLGNTTPDLLVRELADALRPERHGIVHAHLYPFGGLAGAIAWAKSRTRAETHRPPPGACHLESDPA